MKAKATRLELAALRQAIQQEENTELDRTITRFLSLKNNKTNSKQHLDVDADRKQQEHHNTALFSLFCLKAAAEFQLIFQGDFSCREELHSDMEKLFSLAQRIAYEWDLTDGIVSDVLDFLIALCPLCEDFLPDFTGHYLPPARRNARPTTSSMHWLFRDSIHYYFQTGRNLPAYQLLESLCRCSKIRDTEAQYQQLVMNVLSFLADSAPEVECRICHLAEPLFAREQTERAGSFYWLYGCCLEKESQWSDAQTCFEKCYAIRRRLYRENNWFTAVARRESAMIAYSYTAPGSTESYNLLLDFVRNLMLNSAAAEPKDGLIHIECRIQKNGWQLCVLDKGRGIPEQALSKITEPFYRVDTGRARSQGGNGLGLALCSLIAQAHGDHLHIESRVGEGTRVWLVLPFCKDSGTRMVERLI